MRIKYSYCEKSSEKLEEVLRSAKIKFKSVGDDILVPKMVSFSLYGNTLEYKSISKYIKGHGVVTAEYTKQELADAKFLCLRPTKNAVEIVNVDEAFCFTCQTNNLFGTKKYYHKKQVGAIKAKMKKPFPTSVHFFSAATGFSEIFVTKRVIDLIKGDNISGIDLSPIEINNYYGDAQLYQLRAKSKISQNDITHTGKVKYIYDNSYQLCLSCNECELIYDFYSTDAIFGDGLSQPFYLISQVFYRLLLQEGLTKSVQFSPVQFLKN